MSQRLSPGPIKINNIRTLIPRECDWRQQKVTGTESGGIVLAVDGADPRRPTYAAGW